MRSASVLIKKVLACVVGLGMMGLAACGSGAGGSSTNDASSAARGGSSSSSSSASNGKAIVVYFSASGNTKRAAEAIAEELDAPTFELTPQQPYTDDDLDWTDPDSRVIREHENESLQDVKLADTKVPDWDTYGTVYLGFPIWWMAPAWPVNDFVKSNDFTGKTVLHFRQFRYRQQRIHAPEIGGHRYLADRAPLLGFGFREGCDRLAEPDQERHGQIVEHVTRAGLHTPAWE